MTRYLLFTSPVCVPCKRMKPLIAQEAIVADVVIDDVDVMNDSKGKRLLFDVSTVPTLLAYDEYGELERIVGMKSQADLVTFFQDTK
ncbi:thioredoxin family protein [Streptomyces hundungensis]|uniref:thioredoxin family protein n=1 Tax=Streptomyces hundungensis TaxID=1077946 RepID=UPI0031E551E7